ncbi:hypothetical protein HYALB_00011089 [Hymenoscyphus albidus]|uniref:DUF5672 domain-containing protein n=1 Tax=Hymenoscyphus albidus TaxID=595503 RepID=A0A9N9LXQ8_9HELO|nr:hypothetical protein HYALB_00011089 [Hymenoscyphus albidus]
MTRPSEESQEIEPFISHNRKILIPGRERLSSAVAILLVTNLVFAILLLRGANYTTQAMSPETETQISNPYGLQISTEKAAAIVENQPLESLVPISLHFSSVLGPEWPIHIFTSAETQHLFTDSEPFQREVAVGRFIVRLLPEEEKLSSRASVSAFFTKPWLWEQLAPAEHILLFQADSILCSKAPLKVEGFLEYDFVGAPVREGLGMGYNGGLSIRNRTMCLDIVNNFDWQVERHGDHSNGNADYEDQWFCKKMREYLGAKIPEPDIAMKFSVETIWYEKPLGFHQPNVWQAEKMEEIYH